MFVRVITCIVLVDLYAWLHEVEAYNFPTAVTCIVAFGILDIIMERIFKNGTT